MTNMLNQSLTNFAQPQISLAISAGQVKGGKGDVKYGVFIQLSFLKDSEKLKCQYGSKGNDAEKGEVGSFLI